MEKICHRCGGQVAENIPFCPSCGAPQIRVTARSYEPDPADDAEMPPSPPPRPDPLTSQAVPRPEGRPAPIDWRSFLRVAAPLVLLVGLFVLRNALLGWLVVLPASIFVAIHLYRRHHPIPLKISQGAKMGAMVGFFGFALQAVLMVAVIVHDPAEFRHEAEDQVRQALANAPDAQGSAQGKDMVVKLVSTAEGMALLVAMGMIIILAFLLTIGGLSGALAASLVRKRPGP